MEDSQYPVPIEPLKVILGEDLSKLEEAVRQAQANMIMGRTPTEMIRQRRGRGGRMYPYIEHQYDEQQLDFIFGWRWSFEVVRESVGNAQVWVLGKLTTPVGVKMQYGGSEIKRYKQDRYDDKGDLTYHAGDIIDISDDLKAATSEALKKCASLLGLARDVYWEKEKVEAAFQSEEEREKRAKEEMF